MQDVHIGGDHGFVEWCRVHVSRALALDAQCLLATPLGRASALENWRPVFEFGGGGFEWTVHSAAWASEWERNVQWPFLYMDGRLNATQLWPRPRSPWPSWADGGQTVRTRSGPHMHWNTPSARVLGVGETLAFGMRLSPTRGGPRARNEALLAAGEPVLCGVPGFTIATDMTRAELLVALPKGMRVVGARSSKELALRIGATRAVPSTDPAAASTLSVAVKGVARGRARVSVLLSDGSIAVAHYM
eukprot:6189911-Pleurochrysis_carterae.AAC.5